MSNSVKKSRGENCLRTAVPWPRKWRAFGPLNDTDKVLPPKVLAGVPEEIEVAGRKLRGLDLALDDNLMGSDLGLIFGGAAIGKTVYLFAELSVGKDCAVQIGAGCDWWMQWWVNGKPVFDTLTFGNDLWAPAITDHIFPVQLKKGKNILAVRAISGSGFKFAAAMASPFGAAGAADAAGKLKVDFAYATALPHRFTVARPESGDKTLVDLYRDHLRLLLPDASLVAAKAMAPDASDTAAKAISVTAEVNGRPLYALPAARSGGYLPALVCGCTSVAKFKVTFEIAGGKQAAMCRVQATNTDGKPHAVTIRCAASDSRAANGQATDHLTAPAGAGKGAERILVLGAGTSQPPAESWSRGLALAWTVAPGQTRTGWIVWPYRAGAVDLPALRDKDWAAELAGAKKEWQELLDRAVRVKIPDAAVQQAFYACLADILLMRDPVKGPGGKEYVAGLCGSDRYRFPNSCEPSFAAVALDCVGLHNEAETGFRWNLAVQAKDGCWNDPGYWPAPGIHCFTGMKSYTAMEHYRITRDEKHLADVYPRMAASSRWQDRERAKTRVLNEGKRPLGYGLLAQGSCDCLLPEDPSGRYQYIPYNIWAVYADRCTVEAAEILGKTQELPELKAIYQRGRDDLLQCLQEGCIQKEGYRCIPALPGNRNCGGRWGALHVLWPCGLLPKDHALVTGTLRDFERYVEHRGGTNPWTAITLDNLAAAHLACGDGDAFIKDLYAVLNHGTPLHTWVEQRGPEPGTTGMCGDHQHAYTPINVVQAIRNSLVMEDGDGLHLARGTAREWLASGLPLGIAKAPTHFGEVSFEMQYDAAIRVTGEVTFAKGREPAWAVVNIRLPGKRQVTAVNPASGATVLSNGEGLRWKAPRGTVRFEATLGTKAQQLY